ncbi:hypothetical protein ACVXHM_16830 [Pseudomonas aeruginosa]|jgi:hypothetical protein|uniref:hypothetical protein n=1 Tax=Ectopseudomonas guguanensis TaxID=1198456 RepID=UPI001F4C57FE|nr:MULTISPECIES: hypothetical protein [Pseudomonas]MCV4061281.1 hypothetical protein [Pseudomonas aeruginosa]MCV4077234.1 hypothetical protein [Pseudomonas aeruginosa]MCV4148695.1 hypothetical protein [Pseudomonas aeruginosa]MCV4180502.1 hypothetical protein [Pseudomonas aeruginosa]MCV4219965.1 hypothetical protein [Pseudomonas aeruginosa]
MIPKSLGWLGKQVRSADGRLGSITNEFVGLGFVTLTLTPESGADEVVTLLSNGGSNGSSGWQWLCDSFSGEPFWVPLGNQH